MEKITPKQNWIQRNYHWVVFLAAFLSFFVAVGMKNNLYAMFLIPITEDLQISRGAFSLAPSIRYFASFLSNLAFAVIYQRYGYRRTTTLAMISMGLTFVLYSSAQSVLPFYIGAVIGGLFEPYYATACTSRIVREWFHRRQGTIIGIVMAASGLGTSLFSGMLTGVTQKSSWRTAQLLTAGIFFVAALVVFCFVVDSPAKKGLRPWGEGEEKEQQAARAQKKETVMIPKQVLHSRPYFYLMILGAFLSCCIVCGVYSLIPAHVEDQGMTPAMAALIQSIMFLLLAGSKVMVGAFCDWIGAKRVMIICLICSVIGMAVLAAVRTPWLAILGATVFALPMSIPSVMLPLLTSDVFDHGNYGYVLGITLAMVSLGGAIGGPAINFSYDLLGSYTPAFFVLSGLSAVTLAVYLVAFRGAAREKKQMEEAKNA